MSYFLTVDWCKKGRRGIFCNSKGQCFRKDDEPHTELEMYEILDPFWLVLAPESKLFLEQDLTEYVHWFPLEEYSFQFGVAQREAK